jgi:hypothetical protein
MDQLIQLVLMLEALEQTEGEFHESWALGVKRKGHPNLEENIIIWTEGANT